MTNGSEIFLHAKGTESQDSPFVLRFLKKSVCKKRTDMSKSDLEKPTQHREQEQFVQVTGFLTPAQQRPPAGEQGD